METLLGFVPIPVMGYFPRLHEALKKMPQTVILK